MTFRTGPRLRSLAGVLVLAIAACATPAGAPDYRDAHVVQVEPRVFSTAVPLYQADGRPDATGVHRMRALVRDYVRRGRGPLLVATAPGDDGIIDLIADEVEARLVAEGVSSGDIVWRPGQASVADANVVVLSFRGHQVKLPECGDWSGETGFNPTNLPHTNYGCAYQRNIGAMVSDPGHLVKPLAIGSIDAQRIDDIIGKMRAGETTGTAAPEAEEGEVTTGAE